VLLARLSSREYVVSQTGRVQILCLPSVDRTPFFRAKPGQQGRPGSRKGTSVDGLVRTSANLENARAFLTRQHGQNEVWEIVKTRRGDD